MTPKYDEKLRTVPPLYLYVRRSQHCAYMPPPLPNVGDASVTGGHSKEDRMLLVKIRKYIGVCVYRRSCLIWSPVLVGVRTVLSLGTDA